MSILNRVRAVFALGAAGVALAFAPASAKELKLGHYIPSTHISHTQALMPWAKEVSDKTNGELTVKIFPASQLGGAPPGYYKMITGGVIDVGMFSPNLTPGVFPRTAVIEMPVPPKNAEHAKRILDALWDKYLADDYKDVKFLGHWCIDEFVVGTKSRPIRTLADMKGMKIRSPSNTQNLVMEALGAVPVNMPITDVFSAMDTGTVEGMAGGASVVFSFKIIDVAKYYSFGTPLSTTTTAVAMNKRVWDALPEAHKKVIDETRGGMSSRGAAAYDDLYAKAIDFIKEKGGGREVIRVSQEEQAKMQLAAKPVVEAWIAEVEKQGIPGREMWEARLKVQ